MFGDHMLPDERPPSFCSLCSLQFTQKTIFFQAGLSHNDLKPTGRKKLEKSKVASVAEGKKTKRLTNYRFTGHICKILHSVL